MVEKLEMLGGCWIVVNFFVYVFNVYFCFVEIMDGGNIGEWRVELFENWRFCVVF